MKDFEISPLYAYKAANFLLDMDLCFIKEHLKQDSKKFIDDLKIALSNYKKPFDSKSPRETIENLESNLFDLTKAVNNFYFILTNEGKELIRQILSQQFKLKTGELL